jgi:hypothetical protein
MKNNRKEKKGKKGEDGGGMKRRRERKKKFGTRHGKEKKKVGGEPTRLGLGRDEPPSTVSRGKLLQFSIGLIEL